MAARPPWVIIGRSAKRARLRGRLSSNVRPHQTRAAALHEEFNLYAIKTEIRKPDAAIFDFADQKTMYGGKKVAVGDTIYLFASENDGGFGLVARAVVTSATQTPRKVGVERQTPRVSITAKRTARAQHALGRKELKPHDSWNDEKPETELNFKLYRQATNKIVGLSEGVASFLEGYF